eukprot:7201185-Lingulodinium_polyedra.AAC.1
MAGQRAADERFVKKKPTRFWTNSPDMAYVLQGLICDGRHEHARAEGADARRAQFYAWALASR